MLDGGLGTQFAGHGLTEWFVTTGLYIPSAAQPVNTIPNKAIRNRRMLFTTVEQAQPGNLCEGTLRRFKVGLFCKVKSEIALA